MENNTDQAAPAEHLDAGATFDSTQRPGNFDHASLNDNADSAQSSESADVVESPEFPERAFTEGDTDGRVQSSAKDRVFVAGVGFADVSHPE